VGTTTNAIIKSNMDEGAGVVGWGGPAGRSKWPRVQGPG
jgi:hypothetical protein